MDLFAFFKFYYFSITGKGNKRGKLIDHSMLEILVTPLALFVMHMVAGFVFLFHTDSMIVTYMMPIWIFVIIGNLIYSNSVRDNIWKEEQERKDKLRQKERKAKEAERMYRNWQEHARRKAESDRQEFERRERMYRNYRSSNSNQSRSNYTHNTNRNTTSDYMNAISLMDLNDNASEKEIKSAYKRLAKIHHPDLGGTQNNFIKLKKAYDYLMNK